MQKALSQFPEWRILAYLGIIALSWYLLTVASSFLSFFADIFLLLFLSWIIAFIIEPVVAFFSKRGLNRTSSAVVVYLFLAVCFAALLLIVIPTTIAQLSQLSTIIPTYIPVNSPLSPRIEDFLASTLGGSVALASQLASALTYLLLVFFLSFYILISRSEISKFILNLIPEAYEADYLFLENTINTSFASFLRIQVLLGLVFGLITLLTLSILKIDFAITSSLAAGILAMIPVVGAAISFIPPLLTTFIAAPQKFIIVAIVLLLFSQILYNIWAPRLLGKALQIHPLVVLISFVIGYKIAGIWGAVFAVPVTSALALISKDILKYWKEEADSPSDSLGLKLPHPPRK